MKCWICNDRDCGGWGCVDGGMPVLTPAQLLAMNAPSLCIRCEQRPALSGLASNYCEECNDVRPSKYAREPSEAEQIEREIFEQSAFERENAWGADKNRHGSTVWRGE